MRRHDTAHSTRCEDQNGLKHIEARSQDGQSKQGFLVHLKRSYHLFSVRGVLKLIREQLEHNLAVENGAPDGSGKSH